MTDFDTFGLDNDILQALKEMNYEKASAVQAETIPLVLTERDVLCLAQTGSGKTAACAIPVCQRVDVKRKDIQALIIVPTRELCLQYASEVQRIGRRRGVAAFSMFGGQSYGLQRAKLKHGVQVLVATPGRLIDFIYQNDINLTEVTTMVLDEADEMLNMGFYEDISIIFDCLVHDHEVLLFSATMPRDIEKIAEKHMKDPVRIKLHNKTGPPKNIKHYFAYCQVKDRLDKLDDLIKSHHPAQAMIFCRSRIQTERICKALKRSQSSVDFLHGGLNQGARQTITRKFRSKKTRILVATDVAARGLDFSDVTHIFIFELSKDVETYIHRSGRTGRMDKEGCVITLVTQTELGTLRRIIPRLGSAPIWEGDPPRDLKRGLKRGLERDLKTSGDKGKPGRSQKPRSSRKPRFGTGKARGGKSSESTSPKARSGHKSDRAARTSTSKRSSGKGQGTSDKPSRPGPKLRPPPKRAPEGRDTKKPRRRTPPKRSR